MRKLHWHEFWLKDRGSCQFPEQPRLHRLTENIGAASIILSPEEVQEIEIATSKINETGNRYTEQMERSTGL